MVNDGDARRMRDLRKCDVVHPLPQTEQPIKDAVITVPAFFNQAERRAVLQAARLAGLKVLQLINDNTAVALNYGVFRRKDIDSTAKVGMIQTDGWSPGDGPFCLFPDF